MKQLSFFDMMAAPPAPVAAPVAAKVKLSPWQIEQRDSRLARFAYRDSLPSDDAGMLNQAWIELRAYDTAVRNADYDGMVISGNRLKAIGEHAFGLTVEEAQKGGPPDGNERFFCLYDAWQWLSAALAADDGKISMFGQKGRFEIETPVVGLISPMRASSVSAVAMLVSSTMKSRSFPKQATDHFKSALMIS
ncbi:hypothetical protein HGP14_23295 [Rhizobium sp. P32RR-XVIII]|uniref:hypothetical protein n=1 Tax=Rhizobium sp. P32RR-XVIII TaxID=2726738 RepID=UPI001456F0B7|nr:hypothetical protein [Rhizobium sp. P32RR-XVIII]NLS06257.1 hypothetical protein [Rhizobium sp. P32RR-XVIII]